MPNKNKKRKEKISFYPLKPKDVLKELLEIKPKKNCKNRGKNNANRRKN